jgi:hypothetical protein
MSHTIYTSPGIVLSSRASGEADRTISLLTRDFGLLRVKAQSVRKVESKMRFLTQTFSHGIYDCVMTQGGWRLTGTAQLVEDLSLEVEQTPFPYDDSEFLRIMKRGADIIKLCVQGEDPNHGLYNHMHQSLGMRNPFTDQAEAAAWYMGFELLMLTKILAALGYFDVEKYELPMQYSNEAILSLVTDKALLIRRINEALHATSLIESSR